MIEETNPLTPPASKKKPSTGKIIGFGCGGLIVLIFIIAGIAAIVDPEGFKRAGEKGTQSDTTKEAVKQSDTANETGKLHDAIQESASTWPAKGLGIGRDRIATEWGSLAPGFKYNTRTPIDGQESVYGEFPGITGTGVQIIGPANDPYIIVFSVNKQTGLNDKEVNSTIIPLLRTNCARIMGPECAKWISKEIGGNWPKEGVDMTTAELESGNRQYLLHYSSVSVDLRIEATALK